MAGWCWAGGSMGAVVMCLYPNQLATARAVKANSLGSKRFCFAGGEDRRSGSGAAAGAMVALPWNLGARWDPFRPKAS